MIANDSDSAHCAGSFSFLQNRGKSCTSWLELITIASITDQCWVWIDGKHSMGKNRRQLVCVSMWIEGYWVSSTFYRPTQGSRRRCWHSTLSFLGLVVFQIAFKLNNMDSFVEFARGRYLVDIFSAPEFVEKQFRGSQTRKNNNWSIFSDLIDNIT